MKKNTKKKKNKSKRKMLARQNSLKRFFTVFYAVNAVITGLMLLYIGVTTAGRNTKRNIDGSFPDLIFFDDIIDSIIR